MVQYNTWCLISTAFSPGTCVPCPGLFAWKDLLRPLSSHIPTQGTRNTKYIILLHPLHFGLRSGQAQLLGVVELDGVCWDVLYWVEREKQYGQMTLSPFAHGPSNVRGGPSSPYILSIVSTKNQHLYCVRHCAGYFQMYFLI